MKNASLKLSRPAVFALCLGGTALAHQGATGVVKDRMDQMGGIAKAMKVMGAMFKGQAPYDIELVQSLASQVAASGGTALSDLFPEHSLKAPSEARAEIWTDWDRFADLSNKMQSAAIALAEGAANSEDGTAGTPSENLFRDLAETCKACHQDFRIKK